MGQIVLPRPFTMQTTPRDLEYQNAMAKHIYPRNTPSPFFYPRAPQSLRGLSDGDPIPPNYNGGCVGYDYPAWASATGVENCGILDNVDAQYACVQRNQPKLNFIQSLPGTCITPDMLPSGYTPTAGGSYDYFLQNQAYLQNQYNNNTQLTPGTGTTSTGSPQVTFTTSRGTNNLRVGDTWSIRITGAYPGGAVYVVGNHDGVVNNNAMGVIGADGTWQTSGTIDASSMGNWTEEWFASGKSVGSFSFNVSPTVTTQGSGTSSGSGTGSPSGSGTGSGTGTGTSPVPGSSAIPSTIGGIPSTYLMMGGAALLMLVMLGGRR